MISEFVGQTPMMVVVAWPEPVGLTPLETVQFASKMKRLGTSVLIRSVAGESVSCRRHEYPLAFWRV